MLGSINVSIPGGPDHFQIDLHVLIYIWLGLPSPLLRPSYLDVLCTEYTEYVDVCIRVDVIYLSLVVRRKQPGLFGWPDVFSGRPPWPPLS